MFNLAVVMQMKSRKLENSKGKKEFINKKNNWNFPGVQFRNKTQ